MSDHDQDGLDVGGDDEFEMRVEGLRETRGNGGAGASVPDHTTPGADAPDASRRDRYRVAQVTVALIALAAIVTFGLAPGGGLSRISSSLQIALGNFGSAYPTPTLVRATPAEIGSAPLTCTPPTAGTGGIGGSPVWVGGFEGSMKGQATKYVGHSPYTRYGWKAPMDIRVEPGVTGKVVMRGERLSNGAPLWMEVVEQGQMYTDSKPIPKALLVLDPKEPGLAPSQNNSMGMGDDWAAWVGAIYIPAAGCYALDASWPGGSWRVTFAAGL